MLKAFKYKILPDEEQKVLLAKHFGSVRFVYNYFLNERKIEYETNKKSLNYYDNAYALTLMKKQEEYQWLKEINSQTLQKSLNTLEGAYNTFFKKRAKFPKFKSKFDKQSFCVPQSVSLTGNQLSIPKFKDPIKVILHRKLTGEIKQCTISKTPTGEYFVSILVETIHEVKPKTGKSVGLDLGIKDFVITSDGYKFKNNRYTKKYAKKLKKAQQHLSRKEKGSASYNKQKLKVARLHKKITNSRKDNLHKVSTKLISNYDIIVVEDLNVKGMVKNHKLAKSISDVSWGSFLTMLKYKAEWNNKEVREIGRWFPSSKTCGKCGYINQGLRLNIREWECPHCHSKLDRDINAAKNILKEGLRDTTSAGTVDNRRRAEIRPDLSGAGVEAFKIQV